MGTNKNDSGGVREVTKSGVFHGSIFLAGKPTVR